MFRTLSFAIVASTLLANAASAWAAPRIVCDTTDSIASQLSDRYAEAQVWWTVADGGKQLAQVYASKAGTWSWVVSVPSGKSCIVAAGKGWRNAPFPVGLIRAHAITRQDGTVVDYSDLELDLPTGQTVDCCSEYHCRPVPSRWNAERHTIELEVRGEWLPVDWEIVVRGIGPSPDGEWHACWYAQRPPHCLWSPSHGS